MSRRGFAARPATRRPAVARYRQRPGPVRTGPPPAAASLGLNRLRQQGFGVSPAFARATRDLRGQGFDPGTFKQDFRRAPHYRLRAPGNIRVAMIRGRGYLYWWPWWTGMGPILVGAAEPADLPPLDQVDPSADPDEGPDEELQVELPLVPPPGRPIPRIRIGEIKGLASYAKGLRQLAARPGAGNQALVVYDNAGRAHLQVFEPGPAGYRITWDGTLGQPRRLPPFAPGTAPFGNWMEQWIRRVMQLRTGQRFLQKRPNAPGPDLQAVP
jgi:hypothetical protein